MRDDASADVHRQLDACARQLRDETIDFTSELVAVASENRSDPIRGLRAGHRLETAPLGLPCERVPYRPQRGDRDEPGAAVVLSSPCRRAANAVFSMVIPSFRRPTNAISGGAAGTDG
jgi:hypothetical protein